jgi:peptide-methionine (S)-S-oxide reductase
VKLNLSFPLALFAVVLVQATAGCQSKQVASISPSLTMSAPLSDTSAQATFGNGCFWCTEAVFEQLNGVTKVESGYAGGHVKNPTYREVCEGTTGHAEVLRITYNPQVISFESLLEVFWNTHDPTTKDRQGNDVGTQYRSAVFYHDEEQRRIAEAYLKQLGSSHVFSAPIVTEISPLSNYSAAEDYHQEYFRNNPGQGYCQAVVRPKVEKFRKQFAAKLKPSFK